MNDARPQRRRVLIVEDNASVRETIKEILTDAGFDAECAANGEEALERLRHSEPPGLILLDLMMPVMNGWVFRDHQLRDPDLAAIPVVLISIDEAITRWVIELKASGYLAKPVDIDALVETVGRFYD